MLYNANQKSVILVTIGIFSLKGLSFKHLYAIDLWFINDVYEP